MVTAVMSLALVVIVAAAAVQFSATMDEMLSYRKPFPTHGATDAGTPALAPAMAR